MAPDAERRLQERGWQLEEVEFGREDEPDIAGCALVGVDRDEGIRARFFIRSGLSEELRADFAEWAVRRVERFQEHGPVPDGWQRRCDGGWQLSARRVEHSPI